MVHPCVGAALALVLAATSAYCDADVTSITPDNISQQPLVFRVESRALGQGSVEFEIVVGSGRDSIWANRGGQLLAGYSSVRKRSEKEFSPPKMWCRLQEFPEEGFLRYRFALPVEWLADVRFEFHNCRAVYTLDVYEFPLKLFMPRQ